MLAEQFKAEDIQDDVHIDMHTLAAKASAYMKDFSWGANGCEPTVIEMYIERERNVKNFGAIIAKWCYLD